MSTVHLPLAGSKTMTSSSLSNSNIDLSAFNWWPDIELFVSKVDSDVTIAADPTGSLFIIEDDDPDIALELVPGAASLEDPGLL
ncbi:unnamed protein product [[Candida] boidinii]|uniref:Unnamed protein product n=1 Tax=Candida boidinii TaxID=5477 RepID=A0A9W6WD71_CANBO|nr:unnamed protein product [[Candida] boidinii]